MIHATKFSSENSKAFSLIEVVLAMGIFLITVLTLVGLLGPALKSVSEVKTADEVASVFASVNAFLKSSRAINTDGSRFDAIYNAVQSDDHATILVFRTNQTGVTTLKIGFVGETDATVTAADICCVPGSSIPFAISKIYRVVLTPSSTVPIAYHHATEVVGGRTVPARDDDTDTYKLGDGYSTVGAYNERFFSMEVRIYAEEPREDFPVNITLAALKNKEAIFTYDIAVLR